MKHVFEGLNEVQRKRLIKGVQDSIVALWPIAGSDFRRFNLENGSVALIRLVPQGSSETVEVQIGHPQTDLVEPWMERTSFQTTQINRRGVFIEIADELTLELSLALREHLQKETV